MIYYIFLDIDGVLNSEDYTRQCYEKNGGYPMHMNFAPFDPRALNNLMYLVQRLRKMGTPKIILSSTWRLDDVDTTIVKARIAEYGLRIEDKTPFIHSNRGEEIETFLEEKKDKEDYSVVILDDDSFDIKEKFPHCLVLVDRYYGLSMKDVERAIEILEWGFMR